MGKFRVLVSIAFRNLFASPLNLAIAGLVLVATFLLSTGGSLLGAVDTAMRESITGSVGGHLQVYSSKSRDALELWGAPDMAPDVATIEDFSEIEAAVAKIDGVQTVIPMGVGVGTVTHGNELDIALAQLRREVRSRLEKEAPIAGDARIGGLKAWVRQMLEVLQAEVDETRKMASDAAYDAHVVGMLARARSQAFWDGFDADPYAALEFLENRVAPQVAVPTTSFVRYLGTDLDAFQKRFDRLEILEGTAVPPGARGVLLPRRFYEDTLKLRVARRFDKLEAARKEGRRIDADAELRRLVEENSAQGREILLQLDDARTLELTRRLQEELGSKEGDPAKLMAAFLAVDDATFERRFRFFYDRIAPLVTLYRTKVGEELILKTFTRSGYVHSVSVKVYGTFRFKGLEGSGLANALLLMDLRSLRQLQGFQNAEQRAELATLKAESGLVDVALADAEAALFGSGSSLVEVAETAPVNWTDLTPVVDVAAEESQPMTAQALRKGPVLNAAILLEDISQLERVQREITAAVEAAGLELKVVPWHEAAGVIGKFVNVARLALFFAVFILLAVTMVILNNSMTLATLRRTREIGTMRAIGAQRPLILSMVLIETLVLGLVAGGLGALLATAVVGWLGNVGLPAFNEELTFFFSGPRLHPSVHPGNVIGPMVMVLVVMMISALSPAFLATRVSPVRAMQTED